MKHLNIAIHQISLLVLLQVFTCCDSSNVKEKRKVTLQSYLSENLQGYDSIFLNDALAIEENDRQKKDYSGMVWIKRGVFEMGGEDRQALQDEQDLHEVKISGFWIDETEVTNEQFEKFTKATGYVTLAERIPEGDRIILNRVFKNRLVHP